MVKDSEKDHVLSKRLNKILESRLENDPDSIKALRELSTFYAENTLHARRNLRSQIEKRSLDINQNFLSSFKEVKESFDKVYDDIAEMNNDIQEMMVRLQNTKSQTKELLQKTQSLQKEKQKNNIQQEIASKFLQTFQLKPEEIISLHGDKSRIEVSLNDNTFSALERVQKIHDNCKILMQAGLQTLALDVMEQMTIHQEDFSGRSRQKETSE